MAVAFAEAGEWKTAEQILDGNKNKIQRQKPTVKKKQDKRPRLRV